MDAMMAVPPVHEHVHQRASKERQPYEEPEHMRSVLGEQQREGNDQKSNEHQPSFGFHQTCPLAGVLAPTRHTPVGI
jgi:hypothetical protein